MAKKCTEIFPIPLFHPRKVSEGHEDFPIPFPSSRFRNGIIYKDASSTRRLPTDDGGYDPSEAVFTGNCLTEYYTLALIASNFHIFPFFLRRHHWRWIYTSVIEWENFNARSISLYQLIELASKLFASIRFISFSNWLRATRVKCWDRSKLDSLFCLSS